MSRLLLISFIIFTGISCKKPSSTVQTPIASTCDTSKVSYKKTIVPILTHYCYPCHAGPAAINQRDFSDFNIFQTMIDDTNAVYIPGVISRRVMPPATSGLGYPDTCAIQQLHAWIHQGALQN